MLTARESKHLNSFQRRQNQLRANSTQEEIERNCIETTEHPELKEFYVKFQKSLVSALNKKFQDSGSDAANLAGAVVSELVPFGGILVAGTEIAWKTFTEKLKARKEHLLKHLAPHEVGMLAEATARELTLQYEEQILRLAEWGISLEDFCRHYIEERLTPHLESEIKMSESLHKNPLLVLRDYLISAISETKAESLTKQIKTLLTPEKTEWHKAEIFREPGIKVFHSDKKSYLYYVSVEEKQPKHGYRSLSSFNQKSTLEAELKVDFTEIAKPLTELYALRDRIRELSLELKSKNAEIERQEFEDKKHAELLEKKFQQFYHSVTAQEGKLEQLSRSMTEQEGKLGQLTAQQEIKATLDSWYIPLGLDALITPDMVNHYFHKAKNDWKRVNEESSTLSISLYQDCLLEWCRYILIHYEIKDAENHYLHHVPAFLKHLKKINAPIFSQLNSVFKLVAQKTISANERALIHSFLDAAFMAAYPILADTDRSLKKLNPVQMNVQALIESYQKRYSSDILLLAWDTYISNTLRNLAHALCNKKVSLLNHIEEYAKLPLPFKKTYWDVLQEVLPLYVPNKFSENEAEILKKTIMEHPDESGFRTSYMLARRQWQATLQEWVDEILQANFNRETLSTTHPNRILISWVNDDNQIQFGLLKKKYQDYWVAKKFLTEEGVPSTESKELKQDGRSFCLPIPMEAKSGDLLTEEMPRAFAKYNPEMPGCQGLAELLMWLISGAGTIGSLCKFEIIGTGHTYPVYLSEVHGKTLKTILRENALAEQKDPPHFRNLDPFYLTLKLFEILILGYSDDKFDNQALEYLQNQLSSRIISFDSDRFLAPDLEIKENLLSREVKIGIKSTVMCLPQMEEALDPQAIHLFRTLNPLKLLNLALSLQEQRDVVQAGRTTDSTEPVLFTRAEVQKWAEAKSDTSYLPTSLPPGSASEMYQRMLKLQAFLGVVSEPTGFDVMTCLDPESTSLHQKIFRQQKTTQLRFTEWPTHYIHVEEFIKIARDNKLDDKSDATTPTPTSRRLAVAIQSPYYPKPKSMMSQITQNNVHALILRTKTVAAHRFDIQRAIRSLSVQYPYLELDELTRTAHEFKQVESITQALIRGDAKPFQDLGSNKDYLKEHIINQLDFTQFVPPEEELSKNSDIMIQDMSIALQARDYAEQLDQLLLTILQAGNYREIHLRHCSVLCDEHLEALFRNSRQIYYLEINDCKEISGNLIRKLPVLAPHLRKLKLIKLPKLTNFFKSVGGLDYGPLVFRYLQHLDLRDCDGLKAIHLQTTDRVRMDLSGCDQLEKLELEPFVSDAKKDFPKFLPAKFAMPVLSPLSFCRAQFQFDLAELFYYGHSGIKKNVKQAERLYFTAAETRHNKAVHMITILSHFFGIDNHGITDNALKSLLEETKNYAELLRDYNRERNLFYTGMWERGGYYQRVLAPVLSNSSITTLHLSLKIRNEDSLPYLLLIALPLTLTTLKLEIDSIFQANFHCMESLCTALPNLSITSLDLSGNCSYAELRMKELARVLPFCSVTSLDLSNNNIDVTALKHLTTVLAKTAITTLNLSGNKLGDAGAAELAEVLSQTSLRTLNLTQCGITDDGIQLLAERVRYSRIISLNLSCNKTKNNRNWMDMKCTTDRLEDIVEEPESLLSVFGERIRISFTPALSYMLRNGFSLYDAPDSKDVKKETPPSPSFGDKWMLGP